jgi:hypothetical protein
MSTGLSSLVERIAKHPGGFFQFITKEKSVNKAINSNLLTKCYNTATTLLYLLTLNEKALKKADIICHEKLYSTSITQDEKINRFSLLKRDIEKNEDEICLYYILMNVAEMDCNSGKKQNNIETFLYNFKNQKTFPGHVFLLEKVPHIDEKNNKTSRYFLYQSYINKYTLKDYLVKNGKTFEISKDKILSYIDGMLKLMIKPKWTKETTQFWKEFTHVNSSNFNECNFHRIKPCYLKFKMKHISQILNNYNIYFNNKINEVNKKIRNSEYKYYDSIFHNEGNQYSNKINSNKSLPIDELKNYIEDVSKEVGRIDNKINNNKKKSTK